MNRIEPSGAAQFANWTAPAGVDCPRTMPRSAQFVAAVDMFSQSVAHERQDRYSISTNRPRTHWLLWHSYYDDEEGEGWVHQIYAYMPRGELKAKEAAIVLLKSGWIAERASRALPHRIEGIVDTGILSAAELDRIADEVWPIQRSP